MPVRSGTVTLKSGAPEKICAMSDNGALLSVTADCYIGGPDVAADGEKRGVLVQPGVPVWMPGSRPFPSPSIGGDTYITADLYGITASGESEISFAVPYLI